MRKIAFLSAVICMMLAYRDAEAQGFWYVPPGADFSYRYGIDLGNGLGFGYSFGFGYGNVPSPEIATASAYADLMRLQGQSNFMPLPGAGDGEDDDVDEITDQRHQLPMLQQAITQMGAAAQNQLPHPGNGKSGTTLRVTHIEFDHATGKVVWPSALERDEFSVHRSEMESLLKIVGKTGVTSEMKARITDKAQEMHDAMRRQIRAVPNKNYLEGQRFINRLASEVEKSVS